MKIQGHNFMPLWTRVLYQIFKKKCFIIPSYYPYSQTKNKKILCVMKLIKLNLLFYPNTQITHHFSFLLVMIIISFVGCELCRCALFSHDLLNEGLYIKKKEKKNNNITILHWIFHTLDIFITHFIVFVIIKWNRFFNTVNYLLLFNSWDPELVE